MSTCNVQLQDALKVVQAHVGKQQGQSQDKDCIPILPQLSLSLFPSVPTVTVDVYLKGENNNLRVKGR